MSRRTEIYLLVSLIIVLGLVFYYSRSSPESGGSGVLAENSKFLPLDVREPRLHTELLDRLRKLEYSGTHRNIFVAAPPSPVQVPGQQQKAPEPFVGPRLPPPPPPLQVPAEFFGYETRPGSGR